MKKINKMIAAGLLGLMTTSTCFMGCQNGFGYGDEDFQVTESRGILDDAATAIETFSNPASLGKKILSWGFGKFKEWAMGTSTAKKITSMFDITNFFNMIFGIEESDEPAVTLKDLDGKLDEMMATLKDIQSDLNNANIKLDKIVAANDKNIIDQRVGILLALSNQLKITLGDLKEVGIDRYGEYEDPSVKEERIKDIITTFFNKVISGDSMEVQINNLVTGLTRNLGVEEVPYFTFLKNYAAYKFQDKVQQKNYVESLVLFDTGVITQTVPLMIYHYQHYYNSGKSNSGLDCFEAFMEQYEAAIDSFEYEEYKTPELGPNEVAIYADGKFYVFKSRPLMDIKVNVAEYIISNVTRSGLCSPYKVYEIEEKDDHVLTTKYNENWLAEYKWTYPGESIYPPYKKSRNCGELKNKILSNDFFKALSKEYPKKTFAEVLGYHFGAEITDEYCIITKDSTASIKWRSTWSFPEKDELKLKAWKMSQKCGEEMQTVGYGQKFLTLELVREIEKSSL